MKRALVAGFAMLLAMGQWGCGKKDDPAPASAPQPAATPAHGGASTPTETEPPGTRGQNLRSFFTVLEGRWKGTGTATTYEGGTAHAQTASIDSRCVRMTEASWELEAGLIVGDQIGNLSTHIEVREDTMFNLDTNQPNSVLEATPNRIRFVVGHQTTTWELVSPTELHEEDVTESNGEVVSRLQLSLTKTQ